MEEKKNISFLKEKKKKTDFDHLRQLMISWKLTITVAVLSYT
jgi:hypothetical protein